MMGMWRAKPSASYCDGSNLTVCEPAKFVTFNAGHNMSVSQAVAGTLYVELLAGRDATPSFSPRSTAILCASPRRHLYRGLVSVSAKMAITVFGV